MCAERKPGNGAIRVGSLFYFFHSRLEKFDWVFPGRAFSSQHTNSREPPLSQWDARVIDSTSLAIIQVC